MLNWEMAKNVELGTGQKCWIGNWSKMLDWEMVKNVGLGIWRRRERLGLLGQIK